MEEENTVELRCLHCGAAKMLPEIDLTARGVFNYFCDGDCEDAFAFIECFGDPRKGARDVEC